MFMFGAGFVFTQFGLRWMQPWLGVTISIPTSTLLFWCLAPFFVDASGGDARAVVLFACVGLLFPGAAALLNFESNRLTGPNIAGALSSMTPVLAVLLAVTILGEHIRSAQLLGCTILGKAEFLNPGGSVKDRAALFIIKDAEERGLLGLGGVIVEGTAGNTGIGLALVGNARGYRSVIVMPETQSQEKKDMLRLCGVDLRLVPAVPYANPMHYARYSGRLAEEIAKEDPNGAI